MKYIDINNTQKLYMKKETDKDKLQFEWEDEELFNVLIKLYAQLYPYQNDPDDFKNDIYLPQINSCFNDIYKRKITNQDFITKLSSIFSQMFKKYPSLSTQYKYKIENYKYNCEMSNRLLISGDAGIGKSYFLYKLELKLTSLQIKHLCIYGKFTNEINNEIFEEIKKINDEFYLIIDAINEFDNKLQYTIIDKLEEIKEKNNINIIISYRTNTLDNEILEKLKKTIINQYTFNGVNFESGINKVIEKYGLDVTKFFEILDTNNPLYIKMINGILNKKEIKKERIGNLVQVTTIFERYIRTICNDKTWDKIKKLTKYLYDNEEYFITETKLKTLFPNDLEEFLNIILKNNILNKIEDGGENIYIFNIQKMSDYLIARNLNEDISTKNEQELIKIINAKIEKMNTLTEPFIVLLFDRFKDKNINIAIDYIFKTNLKNNFSKTIFRKINLDKKHIEVIQDRIKIGTPTELLLLYGGYPKRPFNCTNYLNDIFNSNIDLQINLMEKYHKSDYIFKLKNILYNLININQDNEYINEYFFYSFWLMSVEDEDIRDYAIKINHDICQKFSKYIDILIALYNGKECYIKKSIIHILTSLPRNTNITKFITTVYNDMKEIDAEIIYRTAKYLNKLNEYQLLNKINIYVLLDKEIKIDNNLNLRRILFNADINDQTLLKFKRYTAEDELDLYNNFIINNNMAIYEYNKNIERRFPCIKENGYCKYNLFNSTFEKMFGTIKLEKINNKKMFIMFQEIFKAMCKKYNYNYLINENDNFNINKFSNSLIKKLLLISQDILLGSLMTNYYTEEFSIYNDDKCLGYKNFSYLTPEEEKINISYPFSVYNETIDNINIKLCKRLNLYEIRNKEWYLNKNISIENCKKLIEKIDYGGENWHMINCTINSYMTDEDKTHISTESYVCNIGFNSTKVLIGDDNSRYLTIEKNKYYENIFDYKKLNNDMSTDIPYFKNNTPYFNESSLAFPPSTIIEKYDLKYDFKTSIWMNYNLNYKIICDNNPKKYYKDLIFGAMYVNDALYQILKKENKLKFWFYTEKSFENLGWNEEASLHIEMNEKGEVISKFYNNKLKDNKNKYNPKCSKCQYLK